MPTSAPPSWMPSTDAGVQTVPCGRWFDAVRVSSFDGIRAITHMRRTGPMVEEQASGVLCWLVPVGSADGWTLPDVEVLGAGHSLRVPPAEWTGGPAVRWLIAPPVSGDCLTDPQHLHAALAALTRGPRFTEPARALRRCEPCGELVVDGERHVCSALAQEPAR